MKGNEGFILGLEPPLEHANRLVDGEWARRILEANHGVGGPELLVDVGVSLERKKEKKKKS